MTAAKSSARWADCGPGTEPDKERCPGPKWTAQAARAILQEAG